jgi:hypothetical protein
VINSAQIGYEFHASMEQEDLFRIRKYWRATQSCSKFMQCLNSQPVAKLEFLIAMLMDIEVF